LLPLEDPELPEEPEEPPPASTGPPRLFTAFAQDANKSPAASSSIETAVTPLRAIKRV
jgi:hypothetical protein